MDGNGRWAKSKGLPRLSGHKAGVERLKDIVGYTINSNISFLTLYAFSSENWSRPESEINDLMNLLSNFLSKEAKNFLEKDVKLIVIGRRDRLKKSIIKNIERLENDSHNNKSLNLIIALDYGGREDIRSAIISIYNKYKLENLTIENLSFDDIEKNLMTKDIPNPDLIIRTSGEYRISNFLLWQSAYSEYEFVKCNWPDFSSDIFSEVLKNYEKRDRRFGKLNE
jgi:undecaprenyl diphosphate synthase